MFELLKNIKKVNGKYIIEKRLYGQNINYGEFSKREDAIKQKELLIRYGWIKNKSTGYGKQEHFQRFCIRKNDQQKYIVKNRNTGKTYGAYKSKKYAEIIKKILPFYTKEIKIELIEKYARKEFYKYISYDNLMGYYRFKYHGTVIMTGKSLTNILEERDLYLKSGGDEELMCDITRIYRYKEELLPPFPKYDNINYEEKSKYKYAVRKQIRSHRIKIGNYPTYQVAILVKEYLENKNWQIDSVRHIIEITAEIQNRNQNIIHKNKKYIIRNSVNRKYHYYGAYKNIHLARYVRNKLKEDNWNKSNIKKYEKEFKISKSNSYYYDSTDIFALS